MFFHLFVNLHNFTSIYYFITSSGSFVYDNILTFNVSIKEINLVYH